MYSIGECVQYGIHGICRVCAVEERIIDRKQVRYLVLEPREQAGSRYLVPTNNEIAMAKLRPVLLREELDALLHSQAVRKDAWIADENQRKQRYRELISGGDRTALLQMVHTLYQHRQIQLVAGRKVHLCDENFLRDAKRLIDEEFSLVLGIESGQVGEYILSVLQEE